MQALKPVLVTGASGFVGWQVARLLLERGYRVRALARPSSSIPELDIERATGDLRDPGLARKGGGRLWTGLPRCGRLSPVVERSRGNVPLERRWHAQHPVCGEGRRRRAVRLYEHRGLHRRSSGRDRRRTSNRFRLQEMAGPYKRSKYLAEQVALEFAADGFPVVIVNPTAPMGDHDFKPTPTGQIVLDFLSGAMPAYIDTGLNVVNVRDVAMGHLLACEKGKVGERYILGSENLTLGQILEELARITGMRAPTLKLPYFAAYTAGMITTAWAHLTGHTAARAA